MWKINAARVTAVNEALSDFNDVCPRCRLRLAGVKDSREFFKAKDVQETSQSDSQPPEKKAKTEITPCRACLGVMQETFMASALEDLAKEIKKCGYDADHFTVAISLPVSLALRSHSLNLFLDEKMSDFDDDEVVPIKQAWKWLFLQNKTK